MRTRSPAILAGFVCLVSLGCLSCRAAPAPAPPAAVVPSARASWYGAIVDEQRDMVLTLSPRSLAADPVYGPILKRAARAAAARTGRIGTTLEALEQAEDIEVAVRDSEGGVDVTMLVGSVPAEIDVARLTDDEGRALWRTVRAPASPEDSAELEPARPGGTDAALFVLPGRTWVVGVGRGAERARSAMARAGRRPAAWSPPVHPPAVLHLGGLVLERLAMRAGRRLGPLLQQARVLRLTLARGEDASVSAMLRCANEPAARDAEARVRAVLEGLAGEDEHRFGFLRAARLERTSADIVATLRLPPGFLRRFSDADGVEDPGR